MRRGYDSRFLLNEDGEIIAISTGSDYCAEHEVGSKPMQQSLCSKASFGDDKELIAEVRKGKSVEYPQLLERKMMDSNLDKIQFQKGIEKAAGGSDNSGKTFGVIVFKARGEVDVNNMGELITFNDCSCVGAWDEKSFAFKVFGEEFANKLEEFYVALKEGNGIFAGTFMKRFGENSVNGVTITLVNKIGIELNENIIKAQEEFESGIRLKAASRYEELLCLHHDKEKPQAKVPGYIWPMWKNGVADGEVVYGVNPDRQNEKLIGYLGPYSFESLKNWMMAEEKYPLEAVARDEIAAA